MGHLIFECASVGMPIPAGTQLTNPEKAVNSQVTLPQAEPNGLYTFPSAATVFFCLNPNGTVSPVYFEASVSAVTFPAKWDDRLQRIVRVEGPSSMNFTTKPPVAPATAVPKK